jgi:hypothetical protein
VSYDLFVFKGPIPRSHVEFTELLERFGAGDEAAFEASPQVAAFYADLLRRYPGLEDLPDDKVDDSVWAMTPDESERLIALNFAWPEAERVAKEVPKLARKHGLVLMDPQSGVIVRP